MNIIYYLERAANKHPNKVAFFDENNNVTYIELLMKVKQISSFFISKNNSVNKPYAVLIERNIESICMFLGIAMSRNFYVPIDSSQPINRIKTILDQMQPQALITINNLPKGLEISKDIEVLDYFEIESSEINEKALEEVKSKYLDIDPLYAICTSGSTGVPKGVLISHRSVLDFIPVFVDTFRLNENDVFGNQAPFDFDVSVKDIYSTLYTGATMYIIPKVCFAMPKQLVEELDNYKITTIIWAVSAMCIVAGFNAFKHVLPSSINKIMFSGEVMPIKMLNVWRNAYPEAMFVNLYGPTEITCNCMYYILDKEFGLTDKLPLGSTFKNEEVIVLNEEDKPISEGESGEICVMGTCLALGYYRNKEKTESSFVQNPLNKDYPQIMYRTGDLVELGPDGNYYFAGRKDFQIKHMGHRIELEEIETHINAIDGVDRGICLFDIEKNKIVACYTGEIEKNSIIDALKQHLPKYMIPNIFVKLESLPLNKNGKIDRQKIKSEINY